MTTPATSRPSGVRQAHVSAAACTAVVCAVELAVARGPSLATHPSLVAAAVTFDLVVVVPLVWWWLVARHGAAPLRTVVPAVALGALAARLVLPASAREAAWLAQGLAVVAELALVATAVGAARRALRRARAAAGAPPDGDVPDVAEALEQGLVAALGDRFAVRALGAELATVYHALAWAPRRPPTDDDGARARGGDAATGGSAAARFAVCGPGALTWGLALTVCVETLVVHLWLADAHPRLAWGALGLSAYSLLWLVGHHRAVARRPIVLAGGALRLRAGLRLSARVALDEVRRVERASWRTPADERPGETLDAAHPLDANVVVAFARPVRVGAVLGTRRTVTRVLLHLEAPDPFVAALGARIGARIDARVGAPATAPAAARPEGGAAG